MRTYAIGDIHGHLDLLLAAHGWIADDIAQHGAAPIVHIGDLIDRGPDSHGVIDYLSKGITAGQDWVVLKGNHDRMFSMFLDNPHVQDPCLRAELSYLHYKIGGGATLGSYGVKNAADRPIVPVHAEAVAAVPTAHRDFLAALPTSLHRGTTFFCHAGIRPAVPLRLQAEDDLVWIRAGFLEDPRDHPALIVHGHTAIDTPTHYGNRLNIDSSAAYGGPVSAVVIEGSEVFNLTATGRHRLSTD